MDNGIEDSENSKCLGHQGLKTDFNQDIKPNESFDVEFIVDGKIIQAHKTLLSDGSSYFKAMFSSGLKEQEEKTIKIHLIDASSFQFLISYIYSGNIEIRTDNVQKLLVAADMLQLSEVIDLCTTFLIEEMDSNNVFGIYRFAESSGYRMLEKAAEKYIYKNFNETTRKKEFLSLPKRILEYFLASEMLRIDSEHLVFLATLRWVTHDIEVRRCFTSDLLNHVRLPLIHVSYVEDAIKNCSDISLKVLLESVKSDLVASKEYSVSNFVHPRLFAKKDIFVMGGSKIESRGRLEPRREIFKSFMRFNIYKKQWSSASPMSGRSFPGVATLDGRVYVVGGEERKKILSSGVSFDPQNDIWSPIASMGIARCEFGFCAFNDALYALGGWDGKDFVANVERYEPTLDKWISEPDLPEPTFSMGVVSHGGLIYVVGGSTQDKLLLQDFRSFNPTTKEWRTLPEMSISRIQMGVAVLGEYLYVIGGTDRNNQVLKSAERYSLQENTWSEIASLNVGRTSPAIAAADGRLYVIGGLQKHVDDFVTTLESISSVECYNPRTNTWEETFPLTETRGEAGAVFV